MLVLEPVQVLAKVAAEAEVVARVQEAAAVQVPQLAGELQ